MEDQENQETQTPPETPIPEPDNSESEARRSGEAAREAHLEEAPPEAAPAETVPPEEVPPQAAYPRHQAAYAPPTSVPGPRGGNPYQKTPGLAGLLSSIIPGLGNVYNGLYLRGLALFMICTGLFTIMVGSRGGPELALHTRVPATYVVAHQTA